MLARALAAVHVEAEVADVRAAVRVDHHVVALAGRERREVGVLDELRRLRAAAPGGRASTRRACGRRAASRGPTVAAAPRRSSRPCRRIHRDDAAVVLVAEEQPAVVPARPFGKREAVEQDRGSAVGHGRGPYSSGGRASVGLTSSSALRARLGEQRHERRSRRTASRCRTARSRGRARRCGCASSAGDDEAERRPEHADHAEQPVRRAARLGGEQLDAERAERDAARARRDDRRRRHEPEQRARRRGRTPSASRSRSSSAIAAIGRRPRTSASRPPSTSPNRPGNAGGHRAEQRDAAVREVVHVGEVLVRELRRRRAEDVEQERDRGEEQEAAAVALVADVAHAAAVDVGARRERLVARGLRRAGGAIGGARRIVNAPSANGMRHAWRPMSANGSVITEIEKPKPPASASIDVAYARAPSGASSTTATLATVAVDDQERALEHLRAGEEREVRRERRDAAHDRRAGDADEDRAPAARRGRRARCRRARSARRAG